MKRLMIFWPLAVLVVCACQVSVSPLPTAQLEVPLVEPSLATLRPTPTMSPEPGPPDEIIPGHVRGRLVDVNGAPLAGIELILWPMDPVTYSSGEPIMPGVVTDANGVFLFENIPPGTYSLYSLTWKIDWYDTSTRMPKVFRLEPGGVLDLGEVWFTI